MTRSLISFIIVVAALVGSVCACAESKVVERSAKKAPAWLSTATDGYLVVAVRAASIAEAQKQAEEEIAGRMIMSVARNVSVSQSNVISETVRDGRIESSDEYKRESAMRGANLPFLKGISLAKADDIYWVKMRDKSTKEEYYDYYVKYPFFRVEQSRLVAEFEEYDAAKDARLAELEAGYATVDSPEGIKTAIADLEGLAAYYFDDVRRTKAVSLMKRYKDLFKSIVMTGEFIGPGELKLGYSLLGHPFKVYAAPKVTSNCASSIRAIPVSGEFKVTYDDADCLDDEENYLDVTARIEGVKLSQRFQLKEADGGGKDKFSVVPTGKIILTADSIDADARTLSGINIRLSLDNRGTTAFGLKSIELTMPQLVMPLVWDNIDGVYTSTGVIQINARAQGRFTLRDSRTSRLPYVNGAVTVVNPVTQKVERIRLSLPYSCNWE